MALSDEDYGILYNATEYYEESEALPIDACEIILSWRADKEAMCLMSDRQLVDAMYFIMLSEGREIP